MIDDKSHSISLWIFSFISSCVQSLHSTNTNKLPSTTLHTSEQIIFLQSSQHKYFSLFMHQIFSRFHLFSATTHFICVDYATVTEAAATTTICWHNNNLFYIGRYYFIFETHTLKLLYWHLHVKQIYVHLEWIDRLMVFKFLSLQQSLSYREENYKVFATVGNKLMSFFNQGSLVPFLWFLCEKNF